MTVISVATLRVTTCTSSSHELITFYASCPEQDSTTSRRFGPSGRRVGLGDDLTKAIRTFFDSDEYLIGFTL